MQVGFASSRMLRQDSPKNVHLTLQRTSGSTVHLLYLLMSSICSCSGQCYVLNRLSQLHHWPLSRTEEETKATSLLGLAFTSKLRIVGLKKRQAISYRGAKQKNRRVSTFPLKTFVQCIVPLLSCTLCI